MISHTRCKEGGRKTQMTAGDTGGREVGGKSSSRDCPPSGEVSDPLQRIMVPYLLLFSFDVTILDREDSTLTATWEPKDLAGCSPSYDELQSLARA